MINTSLLKKGDVVAVALSGGKDSMCLLHALKALETKFEITVKAVHVDHSIRGEDSLSDARFVTDYCAKNNIELKVFTVDAITFSKENSLTLEQGARVLRYRIFDEILLSGFATKIATAHHKTDSFETVLFNLFRGTSLKGVAGIPSENDHVIRPILALSQKELDFYAEKNGVPFVFDKTNDDLTYTRNFIRKELTPKIKNRFPEAEDAVFRFSQTAKEEDEFLDSLAEKYLTGRHGGYLIPFSIEPVLFKRAVIIALKRLGVDKDYTQQTLSAVLNLKDLQSGSMATLLKGAAAIKEYDSAFITLINPNPDAPSYPFNLGLFSFFDKTASIDDNGEGLKFDFDKIPKSAVIRTRRDGDIFTKFGGATKKLKEFFIDKKIPMITRDKIPLIADGNRVYLVFGVEISDQVKITAETKTVKYANLK